MNIPFVNSLVRDWQRRGHIIPWAVIVAFGAFTGIGGFATHIWYHNIDDAALDEHKKYVANVRMMDHRDREREAAKQGWKQQEQQQQQQQTQSVSTA
ncbi:unnamed protein product [Vitrella brassicaformis CCMP3155]|uniref:Uncharacterized protein n=1 Tax=Vitrella brassicaformis (strain CCMP3155) TaxID=1169540 RepID=A0A0G4GIC3_VITBC|nr:unnamed protein product [Vitrella brassicaformis CCMP3155]|eukprot:CEM29598.1 unnamed protein product [Vitrella brassicaformis CCMP3155]